MEKKRKRDLDDDTTLLSKCDSLIVNNNDNNINYNENNNVIIPNSLSMSSSLNSTQEILPEPSLDCIDDDNINKSIENNQRNQQQSTVITVQIPIASKPKEFCSTPLLSVDDSNAKVAVFWSEYFRLHRTPPGHAESPARIDVYFLFWFFTKFLLFLFLFFFIFFSGSLKF